MNSILHKITQEMGLEVFPVRITKTVENGKTKYNKTPLVKWQQSASNDEGQISDWMEMYPGCGWGLPMDNTAKLLVIDLDRKNGIDGVDSFRSLPNYQLVNTVQAKTISGGKHLFFVQNENQNYTNSAGKIAPGVDVRGIGGFVVIAPTEYDGESYKISKDIGWEKIQPIPDWLVKVLETKTPPIIRATDTTLVKEAPFQIGKVETSREKHEGERNEGLFKFACNAFEQQPVEVAIDLILKENGKNCIPPLGDEEVATIINSAKDHVGKKSFLINDDTTPVEIDITEKESQYEFEARMTDTGNFEIFQEMYNDTFVHTGSYRWLFWNGQKWEVESDKKVWEAAQKVAGKIIENALSYKFSERRKQLAEWGIKTMDYRMQSNFINLASKIMRTNIDEFEAKPHLINFRNGTYNTKTNTLQPHNKEDKLLSIIDIDYKPNAECPNWERFLNEVLEGNEELIRFVQKAVGYTLTGSTDEQVFFFLFGSGKNGKTIFGNAIEELLGEYSLRTQIETIMASRYGASTTPQLAKFHQKRFIITSETNDGQINEAFLKSITGSDRISANPKYLEPFEFTPTHKLWIYGNFKPKVKDDSEGFWRRVRLIPFNYVVPAETQRLPSELLEEFRQEHEGMLAWAIEGLKLYQMEGLKPPREVVSATDLYREETDISAQFIHECCQRVEGARVKKAALHEEFTKWKKDQGYSESVGQKKFTRALERLGFTVGGDGRMYYLNIVSYYGEREKELLDNAGIFGQED